MKVLLIFALVIMSFFASSNAQEEYKGTLKILSGIGAEHDKEKKGLDVEYVLEGELDDFVLVDSESKTITFEYDSKGISEDVLIIYLPQKLIEEPIAVYVNGDKEPNAIRSIIGNITKMIIPLYEDSKTISIKGLEVIDYEYAFSNESLKNFNEINQNIRTLKNIGKEFGGNGFDVDYILSMELNNEVIINPENKTVTFTINGQIKEKEELIFLGLPKDLINEPILVIVDGIKESDAIRSIQGEKTRLTIPLSPGAKEISIKGVTVIPEFGYFPSLVLLISLIVTMVFSKKAKNFLMGPLR